MSLGTFEYVLSFVLHTERCYTCGAIWALDSSRTPGSCPKCARSRIEELCSRCEGLETKISHMKGAITRARKRK